MPARPERPTPQIRFVYLAGRFCIELPSDPASRRRPCPSPSLRLLPYLASRLAPDSFCAMPGTHAPLDRPAAAARSDAVRGPCRSGCYTASNRTFGFLCAIARSIRAGPDGARRPCSHSCSVRTETPRRRANSDCDSPTRARVSDTDGTVMTRPTSPRLIWRMPSRISAPISRLRLLATFNLLEYFPQNVGRYVLGYVLRIQGQHPNHALSGAQVIDHSKSAALATTR